MGHPGCILEDSRSSCVLEVLDVSEGVDIHDEKDILGLCDGPDQFSREICCYPKSPKNRHGSRSNIVMRGVHGNFPGNQVGSPKTS